MNIYGEGSITAYTPGEIIVDNQPRAFGISSFVGWGDAPGEFLICRNGGIVGGARTSDQQRAIQVDYTKSPLMFGPQDILSVVVEHYSMGTRTMRVNIIGQYF